jgi:hypothetical protein
MLNYRRFGLAAFSLVAVLGASFAAADPIFDTAGTFSVTGTNAPDNFTTSGIPVGAASTLIDSGAVTLTQSIIPVGGGREWITWTLETNPTAAGTPAPPLASDLAAAWEIQIQNVPLNGSFELEHFYLDWGTNGSLVSPTSDIDNNLPIETNPITGTGLVYGKSYSLVFSEAGGESYLTSFSGALSEWGFNPADTNTFQMGELFAPLSSVPEPGCLALLGTALLGLGASRLRRRKTAV